MAPVTVSCYSDVRSNYKRIADAMHAGILACGDRPTKISRCIFRRAEVGVMYGWRRREVLRQHNRYLYADIGYWNRESYWRLSANDWSPDKFMRRGMPPDRFRALNVEVKPEHSGKIVLVLGMSFKSARDHGLTYMAWERATCSSLIKLGATVVYRPKPKDFQARLIPGTINAPKCSLQELMANASMVVAHHSNGCVEAIAAGCAVHCKAGVARLCSVPLHQWHEPPRIFDRIQFLSDVAYTQWTLDEMRSGAAWLHMRDSVLQ